MFSMGIHNDAGVLCKWNISLEDGLCVTGSRDRFLVRAWYPENHLMNGLYEVHFAARDGASFETLERIAGLLKFAVKGPDGAKGIVSGPCLWTVLPQSSNYESS